MNHLQKFIFLIGLFFMPWLFAEEPEMLTYNWQRFSITYPAEGWKLQELDSSHHRMNVQLVAQREQTLAIVLTLQNNMPEPGEDYYDNPARMSVAFGLPIALKLANDQEDLIAITFSTVNFDEHWEMAARFLVDEEETNNFHLVEAFHYFPEAPEAANHAVLGAIIRSGERGSLAEETVYYDYLYEAYDIVGHIKINPAPEIESSLMEEQDTSEEAGEESALESEEESLEEDDSQTSEKTAEGASLQEDNLGKKGEEASRTAFKKATSVEEKRGLSENQEEKLLEETPSTDSDAETASQQAISTDKEEQGTSENLAEEENAADKGDSSEKASVTSTSDSEKDNGKSQKTPSSDDDPSETGSSNQTKPEIHSFKEFLEQAAETPKEDSPQ